MVRDGYYYGAGLLVVAILVHILAGGWLWASIPILLALFFLWFFRDPERAIPTEAGLVVSPGDGLVTEVTSIQTPAGPKQRISIFLSVFDVHVNRCPIGGTLLDVRYQKGKYLNAMNAASADENEQSVITVSGDGVEVIFKQIAGLLARRIVFNHKAGERMQRGQRVGLIKFGSRVDVLLPVSARAVVSKGERVKGGSSILAEISFDGDPLPPIETAVEALV